jgi:hypothetical protein
MNTEQATGCALEYLRIQAERESEGWGTKHESKLRLLTWIIMKHVNLDPKAYDEKQKE